ncbi:MAG: glycosyltransferase family 92 protein [Treponema sp.]|jgi:hypothetical protein|nr:glycosyltransferase family 92 protein [Treponema sp.]
MEKCKNKLQLMEKLKEMRRYCGNVLREMREYGWFKNELSIATMVRNEAPYLKEWIEYHKLVGVQTFYIYDNYSADATKEVLQPYIESGVVVYTLFPAEEAHSLETQIQAFNDAITRYKNKTRWLALIDADEFIVPVHADTITSVIKDVERKTARKKFGALCVFWVLYGFSGHCRKPDGLVIENYTRSRVKELTKAASANYVWIEQEWIKSIVNPRMTAAYYIHGGAYINGRCGIDERGNRMQEDGGVPEGVAASVEKIRINHYWTKSYEEFAGKIKRTKAHDAEKYTMIEYDAGFLSQREDRIMERYLAPLKDAMKN